MNIRTFCPASLIPRCRFHSFQLHRFLVTSAGDKSKAALDSKAFSKTLLLPKTSFPLWAEPSKSEEPYQKLTCDNLYKWQWENAKGPLFVLHDGPPYANGNLHMGHALNKIIKDIINRFHVSLGHKVHYIPGWDCHGLPIENKALQELGKDALSLPSGMIREAARETALREVASQKSQFQPLGIMADWNSPESTYRTLDHHYEIRQLRIFQKMVEQGMIYRHYRPVHYSPSSHSALAEAELEYKDDHVSHSVFVTFDLDNKASFNSTVLQELINSEPRVRLLVWTTTPWTLTANMGIAIHPELSYVAIRQMDEEKGGQGILIVAQERVEPLAEIIGRVEVLAILKGSELLGASYLPIFTPLSLSSTPLKILPASHVTSESGTGLVHCAPAHGAEDYNVFRALGLISSSHTMICHVNDAGKFSSDVADVVGEAAAQKLIGQEVLGNGSKAIVELLKEIGCLVKIKRIKHRYPYDWKTSKPIIVTATSQWFANLDRIKDNALTALKEVSFFPPQSRNRLESFVRSRSEWCISRQRVWGVPIPALYYIATDRAVLDSETLDYILGILEEKGVAHWWDGPVEDFVPPALREEGVAVSEIWRKGTDTMDVWFDSGSSWSMLSEMGVGNGRGKEGARRFDADVCLEGSDQHRGWFQSQLLTAIGSAPTEAEPVSPYGTLITHGMVLDEKGKKMSKSIGNIISPMTIIHGGKNKKSEPAYGSDVLRLWAATVEYWRDMSIGPKILAQSAESMRKIRNSARFCLGNIGDAVALSKLERVPHSQLGLADRYVMHELYTLEQTALEGYASYNFPKVMNALNNFANITLSSLYFDITKDSLYANSVNSVQRRAVITILEQILLTMTKVIAPVMPHLAEEIHATWKSDGQSVFTSKWTPLSSEWEDPRAAKDMHDLIRIRMTVLSLLEEARSQKQLKSALEAEVDIIVPNGAANHPLLELLQREEHFLKTLFIVSDVTLTDEGSLGTTSPEWVHADTVSISGTEDDIAIRVRPSSLNKCPRCWTYTRPEDDKLCARCEDVIGGG
ncbi:tRNA synthetases class I-domain-containing protein [Crucibulum laeve]|uniref:isoleucine--tRNA ligase n=1 Tax=Crucibulum laeve TaxID=68775 RepID=A0A5C3MAW5_9AGAR|nr:tRNA synthetases class I-domain-containing protein [Crucibulum laeve]